MFRSISRIAPIVVMIGAALALTSCETTDYGSPAYYDGYYDGPYGGFIFDDDCCFGHFHHRFGDRDRDHDHSFGHGIEHAGHSGGHAGNAGSHFGGGGHGR
jgi:hypothetical protein